MIVPRFTPVVRLCTGIALVAVAALLGLVVHAGELSRGDTHVLNEFLEHRSPGRTEWMTAVSSIFDPLGSILVGLVAAAALLLLTRRWHNAVYVVVAVAGSAGITYGLKLLVHRQRPPLIDHLVNEVDFSFPSGHTTGTAALAFAAAWVISCALLRRIWSRALVWVLAAALTAVVAGSRLYLGVHWFTDTFAGALVGVGTALALSAVLPAAGRSSGSRADRPVA